MERLGCLALMLSLIAAFVVPRATLSAATIDSQTMRIAMAEAEFEDEDYEYGREEAAVEMDYSSDDEEVADEEEAEADAEEVQEEAETYDYEESPDAYMGLE
jgi:hypothetical protein